MYHVETCPNQLAMLPLTSDHLSDPTKIAWQRPWSLVTGFTLYGKYGNTLWPQMPRHQVGAETTVAIMEFRVHCSIFPSKSARGVSIISRYS